jgi:hypothetical protein
VVFLPILCRAEVEWKALQRPQSPWHNLARLVINIFRHVPEYLGHCLHITWLSNIQINICGLTDMEALSGPRRRLCTRVGYAMWVGVEPLSTPSLSLWWMNLAVWLCFLGTNSYIRPIPCAKREDYYKIIKA